MSPTPTHPPTPPREATSEIDELDVALLYACAVEYEDSARACDTPALARFRAQRTQTAARLREMAECIGALVTALRSSEAARREVIPCGVCLGRPLKSGRECICGGIGTEQAEMQGLRSRCFDLEATVESVREVALFFQHRGELENAGRVFTALQPPSVPGERAGGTT
jgi:hypothetical protein